jgi:hypothetical protein
MPIGTHVTRASTALVDNGLYFDVRFGVGHYLIAYILSCIIEPVDDDRQLFVGIDLAMGFLETIKFCTILNHLVTEFNNAI